MNVTKAITSVFGTKHEREIRRMLPLVHRINQLEPTYRKMSDRKLRDQTRRFRERLGRGESLDSLLPEAFAVVREAAVRTLGMRHYDVQLIGGIALHEGKIAEMKTGEGKTLVATLPLYLNALTGLGCHLVTVNDYLAKRDAEWMGKIYRFLGMSVGVIVHGLTDSERQQAYRADITYGTNNEFGFDYLRDNMKESIEQYVHKLLPEEHRGPKNSLFHYAIVDEVDSILIDEARTPLIISGPAEEAADLYLKVNAVVRTLKRDVDYTVDLKSHTVTLTDEGVERVERKLGIDNLYDPRNLDWLHHVNQALRAHTLYKRDVHYLVENGKVIIIDEFTGRKMEGRRWSDGLHQAIEAKEGLKPEEENQTLATVTFQNYFRMYKKLAGMTGTAETEAEEFHKIYELDVMVIPTNVPCIRIDHDDVIYKTEEGKLRAVIEEIIDCHKRGQPVLVGTVAVEKTEEISRRLKKKKIPHEVLNAKNHEREAYIVAQAGRKGAVTISTNMAGRGTDIILGGNAEYMAKIEADPETEPERYKKVLARLQEEFAKEREEVKAAGGLHILGTERHESRRIDNQLRGRAGRQGDPGSSRFYLSLEDDLMRTFGGDRLQRIMEWAKMPEDEPITHPLVNKTIERAQRQVEAHNFDIRKNLLEYDNVMNHQRNAIYALRRQVLEGRYVAELTEAERKAGVTPKAPTTSGKWTIPLLSDKVRPAITKLLSAEYEKAAREKDEQGMPRLPEPERLTHLLYRYFGAKVELANEVDDELECIEKATTEIASSLIQQRERLLDLVYELARKQVATYCPEGRHSEDWDTVALEDAVYQIFDLHVDGLEWLCHRAEVSAACKQIVPTAKGMVTIEKLEEVVSDLAEAYCPPDMQPEEWDLRGLAREVGKFLGLKNVKLEGPFDDRREVEAELVDLALGRCEPGRCRSRIQENVGKLAARIRQYGEYLIGPDFKDWLRERLDEHCPKDAPVAEWDLDGLVEDLRRRLTRPEDGLSLLADREEMEYRVYSAAERLIAMTDQDDDPLIAREAVPRFMAEHCPAWHIETLEQRLRSHLGLPVTLDERDTRAEIVELIYAQVAKLLPREAMAARLEALSREDVCDWLGVEPPEGLSEQVRKLLDEHCPPDRPLTAWHIHDLAERLVVWLSGEEDEEPDPGAVQILKAMLPIKGRFVDQERVERIVSRLTELYLPSERPVSTWNLDGLAGEVRKVFYVTVPGLEGTLDADSFRKRCLEAAGDEHAGAVSALLDEHCPADKPIQAWDVEGLAEAASQQGIDLSEVTWLASQQGLYDRIHRTLVDMAHRRAQWRVPENLPKLLAELLEKYWPEDADASQYDAQGLADEMEQLFCERFADLARFQDRRELAKRLLGTAISFVAAQDKAMSLERRLWVFRHLYLEEIDDQWIEHLKAMDHLREGIGLRGYGQRDPKLEYAREGRDMFMAMMARIQENVASKVFRVRIQDEEEEGLPEFEHKRRRMLFLHGSPQAAGQPAPAAQRRGTVRRQVRRVKPNEPCPCGSGKKYKNCHMNKDREAARRGELPEWAAMRRAAQSAKERARRK